MKIRAGVVQFQHSPGDKQANLETIVRFVEEASQSGVEILAFPECCISGYWHLRKLSRGELEYLAEAIPEGESTRRLKQLAADSNMILGAGLIELAANGQLFNSYVVALPDGTVHRHRKLHAFIHPDCSSGGEFTVFSSGHRSEARIGVLICYDNNINENVRLTALKGADVLMAPHQTGGCFTGNPHTMGVVDRELWDRREEDPAAIEAELASDKGRGWLMRWLPSRAHDNGLFVLFANGIGPDDDEIRTGNSMILDPYGRILAETGKAGEDLVIADLDLSLLETSSGRRWIRARRPELYGDLAIPTGNETDTRNVKFDYQ